MATEHEDKETAPTIQDHARRLYGGTECLDGLTDAEIRRRIVEDVLPNRNMSDSWVAGAFEALVEGDPRIALLRRDLAHAAHKHITWGTVQ